MFCTCVINASFVIVTPENVFVNSYPPYVAYMRQWTALALVRVMACRLFGAKPSPEACWLISIRLVETSFSEIVARQNGGHFVHGVWGRGVCVCVGGGMG